MSMLFLVCLSQAEKLSLTADNFDSVIHGQPIFVKFFSPHCGHCKRIAPVWDKLAGAAPAYPQSFSVGEVDCTAEKKLCDRFGIRGVPSLIYFRDDKLYKYAGDREFNNLLKFGAGDYKLAQETSDIPPDGGEGVVEAAKYNVIKFVKDLHAVLRFNLWVALAILLVGFIFGVLVTFLFVVVTMKVDRHDAKFSETLEVPTEPEGNSPKPSGSKKDD